MGTTNHRRMAGDARTNAVRVVTGLAAQPGGLPRLHPQWMLEEPRLEREPHDEEEHQLEEENSAHQHRGIDSPAGRRH